MTRYIETELISGDHPHGSLINCDHYGTLDFDLQETDNTITVSLTNGPIMLPVEDPQPQLASVAPNQQRQMKMRVIFQERIVASNLTLAQVNAFLTKYYKWINDPSPVNMIFDANSLVKGFKASSAGNAKKPTPIKPVEDTTDD